MAGTSTFRKTSIWGTVGRGVFGCGWGQGSIRCRSSGPFTSIPWVAIHFASLSHVVVGLDSSEYSLASICLVGSRGRGLGLAVRWLVAWTVGATIGLPDFVASFAFLLCSRTITPTQEVSQGVAGYSHPYCWVRYRRCLSLSSPKFNG